MMHHKKLMLALLASIGVAGGSAQAQTAPTFSGIALTPTTGLAFPLTYLTQESQPITATVKNTYLGSAATISAVTSSDPQYVVTAETCTAAPLAKAGGTCTVTVKYVPTAVATASAAKINLTRTTAGGNFWIPVTGVADTVPKVPMLPAATTFSGINQTPAQGLAFAELLPGLTSAEQTLTLKNTYLGSAIAISAVTSTDPQFEITSQTCTAAPLAKAGGTCEVKVRFKPAAAGTFSGKINFTRTSAGGNFYANVIGIGKGATTPTTGYTGASLTPTSLAFPDTAKGGTSAEQTITVKNTYAGTTWKVNSVTANISSYKVTGNDCGTLAPGATCTIKVAFAPTLVQALNGTITINRTVGTTTSNMLVKATGAGLIATIPPLAVTANPSSLTFDATAIGASQTKTLTLTNSSGASLAISTISSNSAEFSLVSNSCTGVALAAIGTCSLAIQFSPTTEGTRTGSLTITPSIGTPTTVALTGSGILAPAQLRAEPGALVFPSTFVGQTSGVSSVKLTNTGGMPLSISSATTSPSDEFPLSSACSGTVAPAAACTVSIGFKPAAAGGRTGTLALAHSGSATPAVIQLGGNGVAASEIYVEPSLIEFGFQPVGAATTGRPLTFYNAAITALPLKPLALAGSNAADFAMTDTCGASLPAGATCTATVTFKPTTTGAKEAYVTLARSADGLVVQSIKLTGSATTPSGVLSANPLSLTFPATQVGSASATQLVVLTNTGTANLTVGQATATSSEFSWASNCGTLAPTASCSLTVGFAPTSSGAKTVALDILHTGQGGKLTLNLSGAASAVNPVVTLAPTVLPASQVNQPYSYDFKQLLTVTGDADYTSSNVSWAVSSGTVPSGLSLTPTGVLSGTPTSPTGGTSFQVTASYKAKTAQQTYSLSVNSTFAPNALVLAAGKGHTCALTPAGGVKCWGANDAGQLGAGYVGGSSTTPVSVAGLTTGIVGLVAGSYHTCALTATGGIKCWGYNGQGQLGDGTSTLYKGVPGEVLGLTSGVARITAGDRHTCAVTETGAAKCWGYNSTGQLGDGTTSFRVTPVSVVGLGAGVADISAGPAHTCVLTTSGSAKCWGYNYYGEVGDGTPITRLTPTQVFSLDGGVARVVASPTADHTCAITVTGVLKCWGFNSYGQVGDGTTVSPKLTPVAALATNVTAVSAGWGHTCAISRTNGLLCWGFGRGGELGNGGAIDKVTPTPVYGLTAPQAYLAVGVSHACAMATSGEIKCWGANASGQLGDGTTNTAYAPVATRSWP